MGLLGFNSTIPFYSAFEGVSNIIARSHYQRVIDDGGVIDSYSDLLSATESLLDIYSHNELSTYLAAAIDPAIFGYKVGAGSGTTLGRAASKLYSLMGASSDVVQTTAAAQPLLLRHEGEKYLYTGTGVGDYLNTPNSAQVAATNQFSITIYGNVLTGASKTFAAKTQNVNNYSYLFRLIAGNQINLVVYYDGTNNVQYSTPYTVDPLVDGYHVNYTIDNGTGNSEANFYTRKNGVWSLLSSVLGAIQPQVFNGTSEVSIAAAISGTSDQLSNAYLKRVIYQDAVLSPSIETNITWEFNASDYDISVSQNTLTSSTTGEVWTINRNTATAGYKAQLVYRTTTQGDGIDDRLTTGILTTKIPQPTSKYFFIEQLSWTNIDYLAAFSAMSIFQTAGSPNIQAFTGGGAIDFIGEQLNRIQALTNVQDGASSLTQVNNGAETTGPQGSVDINQINLLSDQAARFGNFVFNTCIISRQNDNATTRTAVYNLSRGWNGNPA